MRLRSSGRLALLGIVALALATITPASAFARTPLRMRVAKAPLAAAVASDDDIPGVPLTASPINGSLSEVADPDDVYRVDLQPGQTLHVTVTGGMGTDFAPMLFAPGTLSIWNDDPIAWPETDSYPYQLTFTAGTPGTHYIDVEAWTGSGNYTLTWSITDPPIKMARVAGGDRYATAIKASQSAWATGTATSVIVATGTNYADALAASALAGSYDCPILLTRPNAVVPGLLAEIDRLRDGQPGTVMIVGSGSAVSTDVANAIAGHSGLSVDRIAGDNRYATAAKIGERVKQHEADLGRPWSARAFVVNGMNYPDALAAAPYAAKARIPILLVQPWSLPAITSSACTSLGVTTATVVGGTPAVQDSVMNALPVAVKERKRGDDRFLTAQELTEYAISQGWGDAKVVGVATGRNFPDALGGGAVIGKAGGVLLLTEPDYLADASYDFVGTHSAEITDMRTFGSSTAVSDWIFGDFLDAMQQ